MASGRIRVAGGGGPCTACCPLGATTQINMVLGMVHYGKSCRWYWGPDGGEGGNRGLAAGPGCQFSCTAITVCGHIIMHTRTAQPEPGAQAQCPACRGHSSANVSTTQRRDQAVKRIEKMSEIIHLSRS